MTILHDDETGRIAQLSLHCHPTWTITLKMTIATMLPQGVELARMVSSNEDVTENFKIDAKEADTFAASWLAYRQYLREKEEAEAKIQKQVIHEAYLIAKANPAIKIEEKPSYYDEGKSAWMVSVPDIGFSHHRPIGTPKAFLGMVSDAQTAWENHQKFVAARSNDNF